MPKCSKCDKEFDDGKQSTLCPECRSILGRRSKRKGNSNELRFAKYLQGQFDKYELKYRARRTPRSGGIKDFAVEDILISAPQGSIFNRIHLELKNQQTWSIKEWYNKVIEQEKDIGKMRTPVIVARYPNEQLELAIVPVTFLMKVLIENDILRDD